jgi:hypothetical protein
VRAQPVLGVALVALAAAAEPLPALPPPGLACLARWYPITPVHKDGSWSASFPDGAVVPYDDGKAKTFEEKLEAPDLEDTYSIPYRPGPIRPVTAENEDPGRIRFDPLFRASYGRSEKEVDVVPMEFLGQRLRVHRKVKPAFERVAQRLERALAKDRTLAPFLEHLGGTFVWRPIANTHRQSAHSYGVSMDINVKLSDYWEWQKPKLPTRWRNRIPQAIVDAFEAEGFIWGGRWFHYDTMHFEYRPELLDPACRSERR